MTIEELQIADTRLTRSFVAAVAGSLASLFWAMIVSPRPPGEIILFYLLIGVAQFSAYIWYAVSVGAAAKALGGVRWHYVTWILVAPFLAMIPIPVVSTIIGVSPLSIKFLLGGQLNTAMREKTFAELHESVPPPRNDATSVN